VGRFERSGGLLDVSWRNALFIRSIAGPQALLLVRVTAEVPRKRELAELVPNHIFGHEDVWELATIMNLERMSYELRHNRA
jgi:hypothetical protein